MGLKISLIFTVAVLKFVSAGSEQVDFKPNCHPETISCSCMKSARRNGFQLNVTVKSCTRDRKYEDRKALCYEKCRKAYFVLRRQRRNAGTLDLICRNGTIIPWDSSSSIKARPPEVRINGLSRDLSKGTDATFKCTVNSTLAANVTWLFNGVPIMEQNNSRHYFSDCWKGLHIKMVSTKDAGNYTCVVQNAIGQATASSHLSVHQKNKGPYILYLGLDDSRGANTAIIGSSVNLTCKTQNPYVLNSFQRNGSTVKEGDGMHYTLYYIEDVEGNTKVAKLEIKNVTFRDAGNYTCVAFLDGITKNSTFELKVVYPRDENEPKKDKETFSASHITSSEIIGIVFGVIGLVVLVTVLIYFCVRKRTLWLSLYKTRSTSTKQLDLLSTPSELVVTKTEENGLYGKTNDTQYSRVVRKPPEVDCEAKYDVFICYSSKDLPWVRELLAELENRQFVCCIDYRDFIPGPPIVENITQAIYFSRKTIAVLSPDFLDSEWCKEELQRALTRIRSHQVVPVMYRNCTVPLVLRDRTYLDWENCNVKPFFWTQLETALKLPNECETDHFGVNTTDPLLSCET